MPDDTRKNNSTNEKDIDRENKSEVERLKYVANVIKDGVFDINLQTEEIYISPQYFKILGYTPNEIQLSVKTLQSLIHPDDLVYVIKIFDEFIQGIRDSNEIEYRIRTKSGEWRWTLNCANVVERDKNGKSLRLIGTLTDITYKKNSEKKLFESEEKFSKVFQMSLDPCGITTIKEGRYIDVNDAFLNTYGYTKEEVINKTSIELGTWDSSISRDSVKKYIEQHGSCKDMELTVRKKDGSLVFGLFSTAIIHLSTGPVLFSIFKDITERKHAEEALRESEKKYSTIIETAVEGILIADVSTKKFNYANSMICLMLGYNLEELLRKCVTDIHPVESLPYVTAQFEALTRGELSIAPSIPCLHKDGSVFWADIRASTISIGGTQCLAGFFTDNTERKQALDLLHIQKDVSIALAAATELKEVGDYVLKAVTQIKGIDSGGLYARDKETGELSLISHIGLSEPFIKIISRLGPDTSQANLIAKGEPVYIPKSKLRVPKDEARVNEGLKSLFVIPIKHEKIVIADFNVSSHTNDDLLPEIRDGIYAIAGMVGDCINRIITESANRELNARLKSVFESPNEINIFSLDTDYRYTSFNNVHKRHIRNRYNIELKNGMRFVDIVSPKYGLITKQNFDRGLRGESFIHVFKRFNNIYELTISPIFENDRRITGVSCFIQNITERTRVEKALQRSEENFRMLIANIPYITWIISEEGKIVFISQNIIDICGYTQEELYSQDLNFLISKVHPDKHLEIENAISHAFSEKKMFDIEFRMLKKDGTWILVQLRAIGMYEEEGNRFFYGICSDITERKVMEEKLRQSEKMEAIGQLAGGIAHDFNNELSVIMGYTELLRYEVESNPVLISYADNILKGIKRSADLISQMLAFSRKGKFLLLPVNLHEIISEIITILEHSIDKRIKIKHELKANPSITLGDPSQLKSAILNLAINARDAMPDGGELSFFTDVVELNEEFYKKDPYNIEPGKYLVVNVTDTGIGMNKETKSHIFEPFFTTKEKGKGTGLGLAAVYGTVKNHKGMINVYSEEGSGTTVKVYLPFTAGILKEKTEIIRSKETPVNISANILLVDDEEGLRTIGEKILLNIGCKVSLCKDGKEAVKFYKKYWRKIDLVILDMIMPEMNGKDAFIAMQKINPGIKALLTSGYSLNGEAQAILDKGVKDFLQKPFKQEELLRKIVEVLNSKSKPASS